MKEVKFYLQRFEKYIQELNELPTKNANTSDGFDRNYCINAIGSLTLQIEDNLISETEEKEDLLKQINSTIKELQKRYDLDGKITNLARKLLPASKEIHPNVIFCILAGLTLSVAEPILIKTARYALIEELKKICNSPEEINTIVKSLHVFIKPLTLAVLEKTLEGLIVHPIGGANAIRIAYFTGLYLSKSYQRYRLERQIFNS